MCWDLILLLTLSIISLVFAISDGSVRPLLSRHLIIDLFETEGDLLEFHVEQHQALSTKSIVALKHRGDDALTNQHDAVSVHNSASDSDSDPASVSSESHLFASATPNIHASLEENLRRVVKFLGEMVPVSLFDVKRDGHEVQLNALVRSFNEDLNTKPLRLRHSDEETPRRCLRATSPLQIQIPVDESIVISPETLAAYARRGLARLPTTQTGWIIFGVLVGPIWLAIFLIGCFLLYSILQRCFESDDPIPASTEPPHELR
jgi:hypothetical protein